MPSFIYIFIIIFILSFIAQWVRGRLVKPKIKNGVQKPGGFDRFLVNLILILTVFSGLLTILGALIREMEMAIVFAVLTLIFLAIYFWLRHEYNLTYEENDEYFIAMIKNKEHKVYYKDIDDWKPGHNELLVNDQTKPDEDYVRINVSIFKPTILLRKIADMTFAGKFEYTGSLNAPDPKREHELVNFLKMYNYKHLVKEEASRLGL